MERLLLILLVLAFLSNFVDASHASCEPLQKIVASPKALKTSVVEDRKLPTDYRADVVLTDAEFAQNYPFHPEDPRLQQTWVRYHGEIFKVVGYDSTRGIAYLDRNELVYVKYPDLQKLNGGLAIELGQTFEVQGKVRQIIGIDPFNHADANKIVTLANEVKSEARLSEMVVAYRLPEMKNASVELLGSNRIKLLPDATQTLSMRYKWGALTFDSSKQMLKTMQIGGTTPVEIEWFKEYNPNRTFKNASDITDEDLKHAFAVRTYERDDPLKEKLYYESLKPGPSGNLVFEDKSKRLSHIYHFKIDNRREILGDFKVYAPVARSSEQDVEDLQKISEFVQKLPVKFRNTLDEIYLDPGGMSNLSFAAAAAPALPGTPRSIAFYYRTGHDYSPKSLVMSILSRPDIDQTLWHETFHHEEGDLVNKFPEFWTLFSDAIVRDHAWPTRYSMVKLYEDAPEAFMKYVQTKGGLETLPNVGEFRARIPNRFALFDQLVDP